MVQFMITDRELNQLAEDFSDVAKTNYVRSNNGSHVYIIGDKQLTIKKNIKVWKKGNPEQN